MKGGAAPVLIQCCADAWHYINLGCLPALKSSNAPVFSQCHPSGVPTLGTVLIGSTGITLGLYNRNGTACNMTFDIRFSNCGSRGEAAKLARRLN